MFAHTVLSVGLRSCVPAVLQRVKGDGGARLALLLVGCERGWVAHHYYYYVDKMENITLRRKLWAAESWLALAKSVQDDRPTADSLGRASGSM